MMHTKEKDTQAGEIIYCFHFDTNKKFKMIVLIDRYHFDYFDCGVFLRVCEAMRIVLR